jgi:hypothetical protein
MYPDEKGLFSNPTPIEAREFNSKGPATKRLFF